MIANTLLLLGLGVLVSMISEYLRRKSKKLGYGSAFILAALGLAILHFYLDFRLSLDTLGSLFFGIYGYVSVLALTGKSDRYYELKEKASVTVPGADPDAAQNTAHTCEH